MSVRLLVLAAAMLLVGCQPTHTSTATKPPVDASLDSATAGMEKAAKSSMNAKFAPEVMEIQKEVVSRLISACVYSSNSTATMDPCVRKRILAAFDDSGQASEYCEQYPELDPYIDCVVSGNAGVAALKLLHAKDMPTQLDWLDMKRSMPKMIAMALIDATSGCLEASAADMASCRESEAARMLMIPSDLLARCKSDKSSLDRGMCLGNAFAVKFLQQHALRI